MKESKYSVLPQPIFRETFSDEQSCQGTPTNVVFSNGVAVLNSTTSFLTFANPLTGVYSLRIKFSAITPSGVQYIYDGRASSGTGYVRMDSATAISASSGTIYVNGVASSTVSTATRDVIITGITLSSVLNYIGRINSSSANFLNASIELFEIYQGTLSLEVVKLLYSNSNYLPDDQRHIKRVVNDGGTVRTISNVTAFERMCKQNKIWNNIRFAWTGETGGKTVVSGIYQNFSNLYSVKGATDATQTTPTSRPYLTGNIAPNERWGMYNGNGQQKFVTHPTITFTATDPWSVTIVVNGNGMLAGNSAYIYSHITNTLLGFNSSGQVRFRNETGTISTGTVVKNNANIGKATIYHFVAAGDGTLKCYANGVLFDTLTNPTNASFTYIFNISSTPYYGKLLTDVIRSGALTQSQITAEHNFFAPIYPPIPTVLIGTQEWATSNLDVVCTPQGNVINEITDAANVENIINGNFANAKVNTDVGNHTSAIVTDSELSSNILEITATGVGTNGSNQVAWGTVGTSIILNPTAWVNKYIKVSFRAKTVSGNTSLAISNSVATFTLINTITATWTTYTTYFKQASNGGSIVIYLGGIGVCRLENLSVQLVGWSGLTEVYDAIYVATSGTAAVKDQAGCLAAAAWCHYNNDSANAAIYGKLYNWYAARTIQYDIDAYDTANPTTPWGYRVPIQTDFTTLQTTLGGSTVAGGKMKKEGLSYWTTPNTGADNSSGFTALGGGERRDNSGVSTSLTTTCRFLETTSSVYQWILNYNTQIFYRESLNAAKGGGSIRLIKT